MTTSALAVPTGVRGLQPRTRAPVLDAVDLIAARFDEWARRAERRGHYGLADNFREDARTLRALAQAHADLRAYTNSELLAAELAEPVV